jgi:hypothetical protein
MVAHNAMHIRMTPHPIYGVVILNGQTGIIGAKLGGLCQAAGQQKTDAIDGYSSEVIQSYSPPSPALYSSFTNASVMA